MGVKVSDQEQEKRKGAWKFAIGMNQLDGAWEPDAEYKELMQKEINGEITTEEMSSILIKKLTRQ